MIDDYIGLPWRDKAEGDGAWACYPLVRDVYRRIGIELPRFDVSYSEIHKIQDVFSNESKKFKKVYTLKDYDIVCMSNSGRFMHHFGVFLDGAVLHAQDHFGVVHERIGRVKCKFKRVEYYRWQEL